MPSWRHVVPEPGGEDEAGEAVDLVVGEEVALAVLFDLALDEHR